jgi:hypothetical protein
MTAKREARPRGRNETHFAERPAGGRGGRDVAGRSGARVVDAPTRERIARATVRLTRRGGQGVVVPGGMIVTAAHVIQRLDV